MDDMNQKGEIRGMGPAWACGRYGREGHDYCTCTACKALFERYLYQSSMPAAAPAQAVA